MLTIPPSVSAPPGSPAHMGRQRCELLRLVDQATCHSALLDAYAAAQDAAVALPPRPIVQQRHASMLGDVAGAMLQALRNLSKGPSGASLTPEIYARYAQLFALPNFAGLADILEARLVYEIQGCLGRGLSLQALGLRLDAARTRLADLSRSTDAAAVPLQALKQALHAAAMEALLNIEPPARAAQLDALLEQTCAFTGQQPVSHFAALMRLQLLAHSTPRSATVLADRLQDVLVNLPSDALPAPAKAALLPVFAAVIERAAELPPTAAFEAAELHAAARALGTLVGAGEVDLELEAPDTGGDADAAAALQLELLAEQTAHDAEAAAALQRALDDPLAPPTLRLRDAQEAPLPRRQPPPLPAFFE